MTLDDTLLEKLAEWRFDRERRTLTVPHPETGWTASVVADCADLVGCRLWELNLSRADDAPAVDGLQARAERLAARATGLLEPLRLIEVDAERQTALLRSEEPGRRGDQLFYYEVLLQAAGRASLRRYQAARPAGKREQVAFPVTNEALAKLVLDLTARE